MLQKHTCVVGCIGGGTPQPPCLVTMYITWLRLCLVRQQMKIAQYLLIFMEPLLTNHFFSFDLGKYRSSINTKYTKIKFVSISIMITKSMY